MQLNKKSGAYSGLVVSLLDERLASVSPEAVIARRAESCLAEHGAFDVCFQGVSSQRFTLDTFCDTLCLQAIEMLAETDLLGECLKDLCAAHARLFQDMAFVAQEGEKELLKRLLIAEADRNFHRLRAVRAEAETAELLGASLELEKLAAAHHDEMLELRRQLYTAQKFAQKEKQRQGESVQQTSIGFTPKKLGLTNFLDLVKQIRASKTKADTKVDSVGKTRETMEQHMYAFLREQHF